MTISLPVVQECVDALKQAFPIEDIWLLESGRAPECRLEKLHNLIVIVPDQAGAHEWEAKARRLLGFAPEVEVFVLPLTAIMRTPRPLLVKMAFLAGENIYRG